MAALEHWPVAGVPERPGRWDDEGGIRPSCLPAVSPSRLQPAALPSQEWFRSTYVNEYVVERHLGDGIFGGARITRDELLGVGAMRERRDRPFSDEDAALLEGASATRRASWVAPSRPGVCTAAILRSFQELASKAG